MGTEMPKFEGGGEEPEKAVDQEVARERERILAEAMESGVKKVETDFKKGIIKHFWRFGLVTVMTFVGLSALDRRLTERKTTYESSLDQETKAKCAEIKRELSGKVPDSVFVNIESFDQEAFFQKKEGKKDSSGKPKMEGFGQISQTHNPTSVFEDIWQERSNCFPKGWINGEFDYIKYKNSQNIFDGLSASKYGKDVANKGAGALYKDSIFGKGLVFYPPNGEKDFFKNKPGYLGYIEGFFCHEIGHANDWNHDRDMSIVDRLELLKQVVDRVSAPDRFNSEYVESIKLDDKKLETDTRATEYWAEICAQYFNHTEEFKTNHPKDFRLVDEHVRKTDKNYDPVMAAEYREGKSLKFVENYNKARGFKFHVQN